MIEQLLGFMLVLVAIAIMILLIFGSIYLTLWVIEESIDILDGFGIEIKLRRK